MKKTGLNEIKKEVIKLGYVSKTGEHQSGVVTARGGLHCHNIPYNGKTHRKQCVVLGAIGNNERVNRDSKRVISRTGCMYSLKAHIALEQPMVIRRVKNGNMENDRGF